MIKELIGKYVARVAKKALHKLYLMGAFPSLTKNNTENVNIHFDASSSISPSAILITNKNGLIVLNGNNRIGRHTEIQPAANGCIKIGQGTSIQDRNIILGDVEFGRYCLTAPNVYLSSGRHYFDLLPHLYIKDQDAFVLSSEELAAKHSKKIVIEDDVWIGINSVIMSGVKIGRGSVIGSNSVVTKDVPPFSIMAGIPAKLIKKRLEFIPKQSIQFDNDEDFPNFYKGFLLNMENVKKDRSLGGIAATKEFTVYLKNIGKKIEITLKKIVHESLKLKYENQTHVIDNLEFATISFQLINQEFQHFIVQDFWRNEDEKIFIVKSMRITD